MGVDELMAAWLVAQYRDDGPAGHLRECPDLRAEVLDAYNGSYGCDTGCEYVRLESVMSCPHERAGWVWGDFGDLADVLKDINDWAKLTGRDAAGMEAQGAEEVCCDMHNQHCEPPGDLCCRACTEAAHDTLPIRHADGSRCVLETS